ncbi:hypothetical protein UFOVP115_108 [uncultured Caudovirales phage]|uniref:Uncharacterized protein n=1 Tax=uncultured Caudovirales phage TaxID=2100421 RepID=A0A6J5LA29_9CAUD|nr:hypothetical protein UFOVP115_108 [uncultured Caudovirales phage]
MLVTPATATFTSPRSIVSAWGTTFDSLETLAGYIKTNADEFYLGAVPYLFDLGEVIDGEAILYVTCRFSAKCDINDREACECELDYESIDLYHRSFESIHESVEAVAVKFIDYITAQN